MEEQTNQPSQSTAESFKQLIAKIAEELTKNETPPIDNTPLERKIYGSEAQIGR